MTTALGDKATYSNSSTHIHTQLFNTHHLPLCVSPFSANFSFIFVTLTLALTLSLVEFRMYINTHFFAPDNITFKNELIPSASNRPEMIHKSAKLSTHTKKNCCVCEKAKEERVA